MENEEEDNYDEYEVEEKEIDPNDLEIINDPEEWHPSPEHVRAYATKLGFDVDNDPPELLNIAEKYLLEKLDDEKFVRAFDKKTLTLYYINTYTSDIELDYPIDQKAKDEYNNKKREINLKKNDKPENINNDIDISLEDENENENENDELIKRKEDDDNKKQYLNITKNEFINYKEELKSKYKEEKDKLIKDYKEDIEKKAILLKRNSRDKYNIKPYEKELEEKYNKEILKYRNDYIKDFEEEIKNESENENETEDLLKSKIENIKNEIKEERSKMEEIEERYRKKKEMKIKNLDEIKAKKISNLELEYNNKINNFEITLKKNYEKNCEKKKENKIQSLNKEIDKLINAYSKEINEKYEQKKIKLKNGIEDEFLKELEIYKNILRNDNKKEIEEINNKINDLFNDYNEQMNYIRKKSEEKIEKEVKNKIENIEIFDKFYENILNNIDKAFKDIIDKIRQIIIDEEIDEPIEKTESKIEEFLYEYFNKKKSELEEIKNRLDLEENEYIIKEFNINYLKEIIFIINKLINEENNSFKYNDNDNDNDNNNEKLVEKIINECLKVINEYREKFYMKANKKFYPFLEEILISFFNLNNNEEDKKRILEKEYPIKDAKDNKNINVINLKLLKNNIKSSRYDDLNLKNSSHEKIIEEKEINSENSSINKFQNKEESKVEEIYIDIFPNISNINNNLDEEDIQIYNEIKNFLNEEIKNKFTEINFNDKKGFFNHKINKFMKCKENIKYFQILNDIYMELQNSNDSKLKIICNKFKVLLLFINDFKRIVDFILGKYYLQNDIIKDKLELLSININEYKNHFL